MWLLSPEAYVAEAARVSPEWPLTHGAFADAAPRHDPDAFAARGRELVFDHSPAAYDAASREIVVGELYERVAKLRGLCETRDYGCVPEQAVRICVNALCLVGLANRTVFGSIATRVADSLRLPDRPAGYDGLARLVTRGDLLDAADVTAACEALWSGVVDWTARRGIAVEESEDLPF